MTRFAGATAFLYTGQGSQRLFMGQQLHDAFPAFGEAFTEVCERLDPYLEGGRLRDTVFPLSTPNSETSELTALDRTSFAQPALFAFEVALSRLLATWGVLPDLLLGHSLGEITAAHIAGVLSLEDACRMVAARGSLMDALPQGGAMVAVQASEEEMLPCLAPSGTGVSLAAVNGPLSVVIAGDEVPVLALARQWASTGRRTTQLRVSHAFHSPRMDGMLGAFRSVAEQLTYHVATIPVVSNVTGRLAEGDDLRTPEYWVRHIRQTVRFADGVGALRSAGVGTFVEVGPDAVLTDLARRIQPAGDVRFIPMLRAGQPEAATAAAALAELHGTQAPSVPETPAPSGSVRTPSGAAPDAATFEYLVRDQVLLLRPDLTADQVHGDRPFGELGLDSLAMVELRDALKNSTGLGLATTAAFDFPTTSSLAAHLHDLMPGSASNTEPCPQQAATDADPIAIIAMACRYPGSVASSEDLWQLVADGVDGVTAFPDDRGWDDERLTRLNAGRKGTPTYGHGGGFLHDAADFDAAFFNISQGEATAMDPQQRLLLETAWEAIERAGIDPASLRGSATGVFVGTNGQDYGALLRAARGPAEVYQGVGAAASVLSGRISYTLGLEGPSVTLDTACSSSLVAIHEACRALRAGDCSMALAGGVTIMATPSKFIEFSRKRGLAADGRCKSFSASADGTGWAEGVGLLGLERLSDARRHGHQVLALIRGSAVGQDGASNGLTAPNGRAQQKVIRQALADAGLAASDVDVVEAHGTGTVLGDPIEAEALLATYGQERPADRPLLLGSLKSNFGHAQAAAGVGGVIKMVMAIQHGVAPRSLHLDEPTPHVDWTTGAVQLLAEPVPWPETGRQRRAGVSAFGISGTNAHVIVEQAPPPAEEYIRASPPAETPGAPVALPIHGKTPHALREQAQRLYQRLTEEAKTSSLASASLADIGFSLATGRTAFEHRAVIVTDESEEFLLSLKALAAGYDSPTLIQGTAIRTASGPEMHRTVLTGYDEASSRLLAELSSAFPVFAAAIAETGTEDERLAIHTGLDHLLSHWGIRFEVELGTSSTDSGPEDERQKRVMVSLSAAEQSGAHTLLNVAASLHVQGTQVNWSGVFDGAPVQRVDLPTYAFQRKRYWLDSN